MACVNDPKEQKKITLSYETNVKGSGIHIHFFLTLNNSDITKKKILIKELNSFVFGFHQYLGTSIFV